MVRHIVAWNYAEGFTAEENRKNAEKMKEELEGLVGLIEGVVSIHLSIRPLDTSDFELLLDSVFVDEAALNAYTVHPEHVRVGTTFIRPFTRNRKCMDFVI